MYFVGWGNAESLGKSMSSSTPFFKAFGSLLFSRLARGAIKKLARPNSIQELYKLFGHLFPTRLLAPGEAGASKAASATRSACAA